MGFPMTDQQTLPERVRALSEAARRETWWSEQGANWPYPTMVAPVTRDQSDEKWLAQAFREAVSKVHDYGTREEPYWANAWARRAAEEGDERAKEHVASGATEPHTDVEDADYNCRHPWCVRFWPMVRAAEALASLASSQEPSLDAAWKAAEAALPEGEHVCGVEHIDDDEHEAVLWRAESYDYEHQGQTAEGYGPTPAAALQALADRLSQESEP